MSGYTEYKQTAEEFAEEHGYEMQVVTGKIVKVFKDGEFIGLTNNWGRTLNLMYSHYQILQGKRQAAATVGRKEI